MLSTDDLTALKQQLVAHEGLRTYLYDDATGERITQGSIVKGHPTWGVGFNCDAEGFSTELIDAQLETAIATRLNDLVQALPWAAALDAPRLRVLIDIAYNAGIDGLMKFHKMLAAVQRRDYAAATTEVLNSALAPSRKARLAMLMRTA